MPNDRSELVALADRLENRREAILQAWRDAVSQDEDLTSGASLPRTQLNDQLPAVLAGFEQQLRSPQPPDAHLGDAAAHGLHRWQQGFGLSEVVRELARLNECVVRELEALASEPEPPASPATMARARLLWAEVHGTAVSASTAQFFKLQQIEAAAYAQGLEQALEALRRLEQQRGLLWQEAAHDLRGNLGVVSNATAGLGARHADPAARDTFLRLLGHNVQALHRLLDDVTCLARLQSGQEERQLETLDVAPLMDDLREALVGHAQDKGLSFELHGSAPFVVQSDPVKLRRITQNLLLNAIRYTHRGGVVFGWGPAGAQDPGRWKLTVKDTGPGIGEERSSELKDALEVATQHDRQTVIDRQQQQITHVADAEAGVPEPGTEARGDAHGEGIGLSIVKRLCELLDATVKVDSHPAGTTFEIVFPRSYD